MSLPVITYNEVFDLVRTFVKNNCKNWTDNGTWDSLNAAYKTGYQSGATLYEGKTDGGRGSTYKYVLSGNGVSAASYTNLENDIASFCTSLGISNINSQVPKSEFLNFLNDVISFCSTKVKFAQSILVSNAKTLIYDVNATSFSSTVPITTNFDYKLAAASDANMILNSIVNVIKQNIRALNCYYTITLASN